MNRHALRSLILSLVAPLCALVACAVPQPVASQPLRAEVGGYELEVLVNGTPARTYGHNGQSYVLGQEGARYVLRVHNRTGRRIEAVVSVDGLDVIDGKTGDFANKRGYLVEAYGYVDIDGWRLSNREAAAFRFAPIAESYAAKTGRARNVGVIGVAVFPERYVPPPPPAYIPRDDYDYYGSSSYERSRRAESQSPGSADALEGLAKNKAGRSVEAEPPMAANADRAPASSGRSSEARAESTASGAPARRSRSGLGTEFGEAVSSRIHQVEFVRANATRPAALLGARYNDRDGLYALGIDVDGWNQPSDLALRQSADPFPSSRRFARPPADWRRD